MANQSKRPAVCSTCGREGPPRKRATAAGWMNAPCRRGFDPDWRCPDHVQPVVELHRSVRRSRAFHLRLRAIAGLSFIR